MNFVLFFGHLIWGQAAIKPIFMILTILGLILMFSFMDNKKRYFAEASLILVSTVVLFCLKFPYYPTVITNMVLSAIFFVCILILDNSTDGEYEKETLRNWHFLGIILNSLGTILIFGKFILKGLGAIFLN